MRKGEEDQGTWLMYAMGHILLGGLIALVVSVLALFLGAVGISSGWLSEGLMERLPVAACVLGAFVGGVFAVRKGAGRALLVGTLVGACLFLLLVSIGYLCFEEMSVENGGVANLIGCLCGGALAGLLGGARSGRGKRVAGKGKKQGKKRGRAIS